MAREIFFIIITMLLINTHEVCSFRHSSKMSFHYRLKGISGGDFGERDDQYLLVWRSLKETLPPIITGAWNHSDGDEFPLGAIYNLVFVRAVTIICTVWYVRNLLDGGNGKFSLNFGIGGPVEVPPVGVAIVVARILLPPL